MKGKLQLNVDVFGIPMPSEAPQIPREMRCNLNSLKSRLIGGKPAGHSQNIDDLNSTLTKNKSIPEMKMI